MFTRGASGPTIACNLLSANSIDIARVNSIAAKKPTIVLVNFSRPWTLEELSDRASQTLMGTFGTTQDAVLDIISGKFNPVGRLPFAIPSSEEAVQNNQEDVPGNLEPEGYALFECGYGLNYL